MSGRFLAVLGVLAVVSEASGPLAGQTAKSGAPANARAVWTASSQTPDGQPDLQGVWTFTSLTPMERPARYADREFLTEEEAAALEKQANDSRLVDTTPREGDTGTYNRFWGGRVGKLASLRTSLIVDPPGGRLPAFTPQGQRIKERILALLKADNLPLNRISPTRLAREGSGPTDSWLDRDALERCIAFDVPRLGGNNPGAQIVQSPGYVTIFYEHMHDSRVIPLDGRPHVAANIRLWNGDSRGRWNGNTLVVDTTNFSDEKGYFTNLPAQGFPQGQLHLTERFTRIDAETINYEVTVDDPAIWTKPWTFVLPWWKDSENQELFEYACHEGNYHSMTGMLGGARAQERERERAAAQAGK